MPVGLINGPFRLIAAHSGIQNHRSALSPPGKTPRKCCTLPRNTTPFPPRRHFSFPPLPNSSTQKSLCGRSISSGTRAESCAKNQWAKLFHSCKKNAYRPTRMQRFSLLENRRQAARHNHLTQETQQHRHKSPRNMAFVLCLEPKLLVHRQRYLCLSPRT